MLKLHETSPPRITVKFLVTNRCNLMCSFCHNEFQGDVSSGTPGSADRFDEALVRAVFAEASSAGSGRLRAKISGGEPLLRPVEVTNLLGWIDDIGVGERILMSNLAGPIDHILSRLPQLGVTEVRVNLPSLDPDAYAAAVGRPTHLEAVIGRCRRLRDAGVRVRANVVIRDATNASVEGTVSKYIHAALRGGMIDHAAFIADVRSTASSDLFGDLLSALEKTTDVPMTWRRGRIAEGARNGLAISVVRCVSWSDIATDREADVYVLPPGRVMRQFAVGRAYVTAGQSKHAGV